MTADTLDMSLPLRRARPPRPARPEQVHKYTRAVTLALIILIVMMSVGFLLKWEDDRGDRAQHGLATIAGDLHTQDALEWRIVSGRQDVRATSAELDRSRAETVRRITRLRGPAVSHTRRAALLTAFQTYSGAVDREIQLLAGDQSDAARRYDDETVDPAMAAVLNQVTGFSASVTAAATRARRWANIAMVVTFGAAAAMILLLGSGRRLGRVLDEAQARSERRSRLIAQQSTSLIAVLRRDGLVTYLSPTAERILEVDPEEAVENGTDAFLQRTHPADHHLLLTSLLNVRPGPGVLRMELRLRAAGNQSGQEDAEGTWRTYEASFRDHTDEPDLGGVLLTAHDITQQRSLQHEIQRRALHDDLTGLPNRSLLLDRIQQALRDGGRHGIRIGLLIIDLDRFKEINDTLGHHYGDELLIQVGRTLKLALRDVDTVARLGGDEFAVLLPQVSDLNAACAVAWKLHDGLEESFVVEGVELDVEASIGAAISEACPDDTAAALLQRAEVAMYVAKGRSTGVIGYDPRDDVNTIERLALLGDLRRALSNDELYLVYQPKISLKDGALGSAEALLRWQHPERGLIPPDDFIPLAENTGLIGALTRHVLDLALTQARTWTDAGTPLRIAVNTSARNLHDEEFDRDVRALLQKHRIDPSQLLLEVTESALMADPVRAQQVLERLAGQGIAISIDDFGAGYTSIKQLRSLPISELKVDRSFVQAMEQDEGEELIVRSVIELGRNLGLTTVAEGVETPEALVKLAAFGCDTAQGYVLARPMAADHFDRWRSEWRGLSPVPAP